MPAISQVFAGQVFVTHPFKPNVYLRIDVLERLFEEMIDVACHRASTSHEATSYFHSILASPLETLQHRIETMSFPHSELFERVISRRGVSLDSHDEEEPWQPWLRDNYLNDPDHPDYPS